jgi:hypothetical protein
MLPHKGYHGAGKERRPMTSTIRPTDIQTDDLPEGPLGLPDYQERRMRAMWPDIPAEYRQSFLAALTQLPPLHPDLIAAAHEAERQGQIVRNQPLRDLIRSWREGTEPDTIEDQWETLEALMDGLAEHPLTFGNDDT